MESHLLRNHLFPKSVDLGNGAVSGPKYPPDKKGTSVPSVASGAGVFNEEI